MYVLLYGLGPLNLEFWPLRHVFRKQGREKERERGKEGKKRKKKGKNAPTGNEDLLSSGHGFSHEVNGLSYKRRADLFILRKIKYD